MLVVLLSWGSVTSGFAQGGAGRPFITKWQGKAGEELKFPIVGTDYKLVIKNEKGEVVKTEEKVTVKGTDASYYHAFTPTADGVYTVEAGPEGVKYMKMRIKWEEQTLLTSNDKLLEVVQFGTVAWESMTLMFFKCENMTFAAGIDIPDLTRVTKMDWMFNDCHSFNQPLNNWDVSQVTDMFRMFEDCSAFNQPLNNWDVSQVTNMTYMFNYCLSFNQPLNNWNVSKVTEMIGMFGGCRAFNQPLGEWNVSKVTDMSGMFAHCRSFNQPLNNWDVSQVREMNHLFYECRVFNQPLEKWDVSKVTDMNGMFYFCRSFNQPLGTWKIKTAVGDLGSTAMSPLNYSATLAGWAAQSELAKNVNFRGSVYGLIYNNEGKAAREKLIGKGWKFEGDKYQGSGVAITPRYYWELALNDEYTLSLEKWGVEEGEEVTLSSSDVEVLSYTLTADGKSILIKGLKVGECKLTATIAAKEGGHEAYTSTCAVGVYLPVKHITITPASQTLSLKQEITLVANVIPTNAGTKRVRWRSSNSNIATVAPETGKLIAKQVGTCTITATTEEAGSSVEGTCTIVVVANNNGGNNGGNGGEGNGGGNNGGGILS